MITPTRLSYALLAVTIILAGLLHLGAPLLVVLFSYFALRQLYYLTKRKWLALILFSIGMAGLAAAAVYLARAAVVALPDVADTSIPSASAWAEKRQIDLPFWDFESLRQLVVDTLGQEAQYLRNVANFAKSAAAAELKEAIATVMDGKTYVSTQTTQQVAQEADDVLGGCARQENFRHALLFQTRDVLLRHNTADKHETVAQPALA